MVEFWWFIILKCGNDFMFLLERIGKVLKFIG